MIEVTGPPVTLYSKALGSPTALVSPKASVWEHCSVSDGPQEPGPHKPQPVGNYYAICWDWWLDKTNLFLEVHSSFWNVYHWWWGGDSHWSFVTWILNRHIHAKLPQKGAWWREHGSGKQKAWAEFWPCLLAVQLWTSPWNCLYLSCFIWEMDTVIMPVLFHHCYLSLFIHWYTKYL